MTRAKNYTRTYNTSAKYFARTLIGVPTPWLVGDRLEINSKTGDEERSQIKFRLWVRRHGNGLYVETHKDSQCYPGERRLVSTMRRGLHLMHVAGVKLVRMSMQDPTSSPEHPRYVWNKSHPLYMEGKECCTTVVKYLHAFFNPQRGRPRADPTMIGDAVVGSSKLRATRRKEFLKALERALDILEPVYERMQDARRMRCYTVEQRNQIAANMGACVRNLKGIRHEIYHDRFTVAMAKPEVMPSADEVLGLVPAPDTPTTERQRRVDSLPPQPTMHIDIDDFWGTPDPAPQVPSPILLTDPRQPKPRELDEESIRQMKELGVYDEIMKRQQEI